MKTLSLFTPFFAAGMLVMLLISSTTGRRQDFDKITVREFELVDALGKKRASIRTEESGEVVFRLMDATGTIRVKIGASEEGSGLVLLDGSTNPGIHALAKKQGTTLTLTDRDGRKREF